MEYNIEDTVQFKINNQSVGGVIRNKRDSFWFGKQYLIEYSSSTYQDMNLLYTKNAVSWIKESNILYKH